MIKLESLHKFFNKGKSNEIHVINDISFDFPEHGMVALFGRSGCGKTTLLNVIGGLDKVQQGNILVSGQKMSVSSDELRNKYIGYIFQNYCLSMTDTCYDNVATALKLCGMRNDEEIRPRVMKALEIVGMQQYVKRTPDTLSGGQQQRIAIARALVKNAPVILADEPTGNLDEANTVMIMDILKQISKEHLVILVTHEEKLVDYYCDYVIELSDGQIVGTKENTETGGYIAKNKNVIYLGEYEKKDSSNEMLDLQYYGEMPSEPVKARLINRNGVLYLKVDSPNVHVLDETSEVHLEEGSFEEKLKDAETVNSIDMSELTSFEGKNYGSLYSFKDGIKSGFRLTAERFKKKGAKRLRRVLILLGLVSVFMISSSAVDLKKFVDAKKEAASNFIRVSSLPEYSIDAIQKLTENPDETGILTVLYQLGYAYGGESDVVGVPVDINMGSFETYRATSLFSYSYDSDYKLYPLPMSETSNLKMKVGSKTDQKTDIVISTKLADEILNNKPFRFIRSYDDLIGLTVASDQLFRDKTVQHFENDIDYEYNYQYSEQQYVMYWHDDESISIVEESTVPFRISGVFSSDEKIAYFDDSWFEKLVPDDEELQTYYDEMKFLYCGYYITDPDCEMINGCLIHCSDIEKAKKALQDVGGATSITDSKEQYKKNLEKAKISLTTNLMTLIIWVGLICLCMFFVMRAVYMGRVKEIGIARAIGVSKKNILKRTYVESGVMALLSVIIGYVLATGFIQYLQSFSAKMTGIFYYPWYLKIAVLIFLMVISILSGSISAIMILRKTPAEIMSKYDI